MKSQVTKSLRRRGGAFTLAELMVSMTIVALVACAGTYLLATTCKTQEYVQGGATADSEIEFALPRITENIRAATVVTLPTSQIVITSAPSSLISGGTFNITYSLAGTSLVESYVSNTSNHTHDFSGILVHNVSQFTAAALAANPKAFQITLNAGTSTTVRRTFVAFGRNL